MRRAEKSRPAHLRALPVPAAELSRENLQQLRLPEPRAETVRFVLLGRAEQLEPQVKHARRRRIPLRCGCR